MQIVCFLYHKVFVGKSLLFSCQILYSVCFKILPSVAEIAQLGERQTEDLKVPGSNPESSHEL